MGIENVAMTACACASLLLAPSSEAAQRSAGFPASPATTYGWTSSVAASSNSSAAKQRELRPPPSLLPAAEAMFDAAEGTVDSGTHTYGTRGVVELGGFANFSGASNFTSIQISPTAGMFVLDDVELSVIIGLNYVHQTIDPGMVTERSDNKTIIRILGEPSYHIPLSRSVWGFFGIGLGVASVPRSNGRTSLGFDLAPRAGLNILVGRSGLLTPAAFVDYTTGDTVQAGRTGLVGANRTYGIQAGYTVVW